MTRSITPFPSRKYGYSLVEVIISMFVLTLLSLAFTRGLIFAKYTAENNIYESTALTVAVSTIEQMKGASIGVIENPTRSGGNDVFEMVVDSGNIRALNLGESNLIDVPLVTDSEGATINTLEVNLTPSIEAMDSFNGYWLTVHYTYEHPRTKRIRAHTIRNARSTVP